MSARSPTPQPFPAPDRQRNAWSPRRTADSPRPWARGAAWSLGARLAGRCVPRRRIGAAVAFEVVLVAIDEHHHVGVLLDSAGVAEVRQLRPLVGLLLDRAAELAQRQHGHVD